QGPLVGGHVVLHRDHVVVELAQRPVDLLPVFLEIAVGGRDVNPGQIPPFPGGRTAANRAAETETIGLALGGADSTSYASPRTFKRRGRFAREAVSLKCGD